jgi:hypothetical protein
MQLRLDNRVEIALRYLGSDEAHHVLEAMRSLEFQKPETVRRNFPKFELEKDQYFLLPVTPRLRAIFKYAEDDHVVVVEDIVSRDLLKKYFM